MLLICFSTSSSLLLNNALSNLKPDKESEPPLHWSLSQSKRTDLWPAPSSVSTARSSNSKIPNALARRRDCPHWTKGTKWSKWKPQVSSTSPPPWQLKISMKDLCESKLKNCYHLLILTVTHQFHTQLVHTVWDDAAQFHFCLQIFVHKLTVHLQF